MSNEIPIHSLTQPLFKDNKSLDAFNRIGISNPESLFLNTFQYGINPLTMYSFSEGSVCIDSEWIAGSTTGTGINTRTVPSQQRANLSRKLPLALKKINGEYSPTNLVITTTNMGAESTRVGVRINWLEIQ